MFRYKLTRYGVRRGLLRVALALLCAVYAGAGREVPAHAETPSRPSLRLPLGELGFPGHTTALLHAGASMSTVHLLDSTHLLLTYSLRGLVPRIVGDDENDSDRQVAAVLVELPSGKVLARTVWHMHDHGRYLWSVGRGVFVVRIGENLSLMAPLRGFASGNAFGRLALPHAVGHPVEVTGSADGEMLTVQIEQQTKEDPAVDGNGEPKKHKHVVLHFFRISPDAAPGSPIKVQGAGVVGAPGLMRLALDGDGYLWAEDQRRGKWQISFNEFGGKPQNIAPVLSSCPPRLTLLSRSEFLVTSCRGSDDVPTLAAFGFDGHENWEEHLGQSLQPPTFALAPPAGRFAMSRLVASASGTPVSGIVQDDPLNQEIRVYQTASGDLLLHVACVPTVRSAENFDLSPDGMTLAVLGRETLDLYRLPELSARDRHDLAEAATMQPPVANGPVDLRRISRPIGEEQRASVREGSSGESQSVDAAVPSLNSVPAVPESAKQPAVITSNQAPSAAKPARGQAAQDPVADDGVGATPRKPPTLLNPGEKAGYNAPSTAPK